MAFLTLNAPLKKIHRWLGVPVGLIFIVTFGTGFLTSINELLSRYQYQPNAFARQQPYQPTHAEKASAITRISQLHPDASRITFPQSEFPFYRIDKKETVLFLEAQSLKKVEQQDRKRNAFFNTVLKLHRNLLLGRENFTGVNGASIVAWSGLTALAISVLGLIIWWPMKSSFALSNMAPKGLKRKHWYYSHMTSGVILLMAIIMLSLTGAAITYRDIAKKVLFIQDQKPLPAAKFLQFQDQKLTLPMYMEQHLLKSQWLTVAFSRPQKQSPTSEGKPKEQAPLKRSAMDGTAKTFILQIRTPKDWFNLASSTIEFDAVTQHVITVKLFSDLHFGEKLFNILVPLHTGRHLNAAYVLVLSLFSLLGTMMVLSGLVSFITKRRKKSIALLNLKNLKGIYENRIFGVSTVHSVEEQK